MIFKMEMRDYKEIEKKASDLRIRMIDQFVNLNISSRHTMSIWKKINSLINLEIEMEEHCNN